jgi:hypothetical protein
MVPPPDKHETMLRMLEHGSVFVHLDPRRPAVRVPVEFSRRANLVLQIGLNFPIPIRDLEIDAEGFRCTLSFNRVPCYCVIPWTAVFAMSDEAQQVTLWSDDVPDEDAPPNATAPEAVRTRKPRDKTAAATRKGRAPISPLASATDTPGPSPRAASAPSRIPAGPSRSPSADPARPVESPAAPAADGTPRKTRSGREVPPWLRVVK